eukprot:COSAG01_NODE_4453_length_5006_cov_123.183819_1_plen_77_part_00
MKPECAHTDLVALTLLVQQPTDALKLLHAPNPRYLPASRRMPGNASSTIWRLPASSPPFTNSQTAGSSAILSMSKR